jgi:hypothetical protein
MDVYLLREPYLPSALIVEINIELY